MATMTIPITSVDTFSARGKGYAFSGTLNLPQVITAPIQINSATLYYGWARLYTRNNFVEMFAGSTSFYSNLFSTAVDETLRERTVGLVCTGVGTDHILKVQGRTVTFELNTQVSTTGNIMDRTRDVDMVLTLDYTILESASTLSLNTTVVDAGQYITPIIAPGVGAASHKIVWQFGSRTQEQWNANAYKIPLEWLDQIPTATSGIAMATLTTYNASGAQIGSPSTAYFTINCPLSVVPTISSFTATRADNGGVPPAWATYVQGKSGVNLAAVGAGIYGSWITSWLIQGDSKTAQAANLSIPTISGAGDIKFIATAIDSRGRATQRDVTINVKPYSAPVIQKLTAARCDANGTPNPSGRHALVSAGGDYATVGGYNGIGWVLSYRLKGAGNWIDMGWTGGKTVDRVIGSDTMDEMLAYEIRAILGDTFVSVDQVVTLGSAQCFMDRLPGQNKMGLFAYVPQGLPDKSVYFPADTKIYRGDKEILDYLHPIGSIYMSASPASPDTLFGGSWVQWGAGRVPVGIKPGDADFDTAEKTGGSKTKIIETANLPSLRFETVDTTTPGTVTGLPFQDTGSLQQNKALYQGIPVKDYAGNTGGHAAFNVQNAYITCYMWKRTA